MKKCIDIFAVIEWTLEITVVLKLMEHNEWMKSDYGSDAEDIIIVKYFREEFIEKEKINRRKLDPNQKFMGRHIS